MSEQSPKISWYRCKVDKATMSDLMKKNDFRAWLQAGGQLAIFCVTGALAYLAYLQLNAATWPWALPLVLLTLFIHGTNASFLGGIACHEMCHKTPFSNQRVNAMFLKIYSFLAWFDPVGYRASHIRHHQATTFTDYDGEVVLPSKFDWRGAMFVFRQLAFDPVVIWKQIRFCIAAASGDLSRDGFFKAWWLQRVLPESNEEGRREQRNWARTVLLGQLALAAIFIATGHWFLIVIVNFGTFLSPWLVTLCGIPQHIGLSPNTPDFRLCTRTYTMSGLPSFLYWNMQYHVEHHMYPAVPFYNLDRLRKAMEHDLPPCTHGLLATWQEIAPIIKRQWTEPEYVHVPPLPGGEGEHAGADTLFSEAAEAGAA